MVESVRDDCLSQVSRTVLQTSSTSCFQENNTSLTSVNLSMIPDSNERRGRFPTPTFNTLRKVASCSTTSDEYNVNGDVFSGTTTTCVSRPGSPGYAYLGDDDSHPDDVSTVGATSTRSLVVEEEQPLPKRSKIESFVPPSQCGDAKGRRCQFDECSKYAQGSTCYCIKHGGGRRCTVPLCSKGRPIYKSLLLLL